MSQRCWKCLRPTHEFVVLQHLCRDCREKNLNSALRVKDGFRSTPVEARATGNGGTKTLGDGNPSKSINRP